MSKEHTRVVNCEEIPWAEMLPGIEVKFLRLGQGTGAYTMMLRAQPGAEMPEHRHLAEVHAFTQSGTWGYREYDWLSTAGSYVFEPAGTQHTFYVPDDAKEAAVIAFYVAGPQEMLDEDGDVMSVEGSESIHEYWKEALEADGVAYPTSVLP